MLHRHPQYWERPDELRPERWADEDAQKKRPRFASILVLATLARPKGEVPARVCAS